MSLPRKIMEQCRPCPAKLWSNADFAPRDHRAFVLCPAKSRRLRSLPRKIMEQCRLCSAKSWRHSFRGQKNIMKFYCLLFFSNYFGKSLSFPRSLQPLGQLYREKILCVTVPLNLSFACWCVLLTHFYIDILFCIIDPLRSMDILL